MDLVERRGGERRLEGVERRERVRMYCVREERKENKKSNLIFEDVWISYFDAGALKRQWDSKCASKSAKLFSCGFVCIISMPTCLAVLSEGHTTLLALLPSLSV